MNPDIQKILTPRLEGLILRLMEAQLEVMQEIFARPEEEKKEEETEYPTKESERRASAL